MIDEGVYKIPPNLGDNDFLHVQPEFKRKLNKTYIPNIKPETDFISIDVIPNLKETIAKIKKEIVDVGIKQCDISFLLYKIEKTLEKSPSASPDELAAEFLTTLIDLINNSIDEKTKTISLKIVYYISFSTNEGMKLLFEKPVINTLFKLVSQKSPIVSIFRSANNYIENYFYSCLTLENILNFPPLSKNAYDEFISNELLQLLNKKLLHLSSEPEIAYTFSLILSMLKLSINYKKDIGEFNYFLPNLSALLSQVGIAQKMSLKCFCILLDNENLLKECCDNGVPQKLHQNINLQYIHLFLKCISFFWANSAGEIFLNNDFYNLLIKYIPSTDRKGVHEILRFFIMVIQTQPFFDQNNLLYAIHNSISNKSFSYKKECIDFISFLINEDELNVAQDHIIDVIWCFFDVVSQVTDNSLLDYLKAFHSILSKNDKISNEVASNSNFIEFLNECSVDSNLSQEINKFSSFLLTKYVINDD